ncbi:penicillin-binding protein 2 [Desulfobacula toluolica]|uniref:MrdA: penicillin-binding protein 2 n=1 Tax=Desulfobacula toluolica (strain DSM 7467 / Tol2) TaxID=651182 RepID=K0NGQ6_DESTT|nr:penicillin-binding protein 2 [Desulfobacula toluolica]CCK80125.1 MrdA: penicillin-binding protein 2 [Desulfobacula toluolica Tol2]
MIEFSKNSDRELIKQRLVGASICILLVFAILFLRLVYLQIIKGEEYRLLSEKNAVRLKSIKSSRGLIFDRNNRLLVDNRPSFNLKIVLEDAGDVEKTVKKLAELIRIPLQELMDTIDRAGKGSFYKAVTLKDDISREQLAIVESHKFDLPGIHIDIEPTRHYIHKKTAAHLLGYLGQVNSTELRSGKYPDIKTGDSIGRYGIEKSFEKYLQGKRGGRQIEVDANGRTIKILKTVEPIAGLDLNLTLDLDLQKTAEKLFDNRDGAVVAIDPNNGDILVMASNPSFDQNDFIGGISTKNWETLISNPGKPMTNKAIQAEYPPASTYKIITSFAALEEKHIDSHSTVYCPGFLKYGNRRYRCWNKHGHGEMNVIKALTQSCDVFFYQAGDKAGVDTLAQYAKGCGLGKKTGIMLDNERKGLVPTSAWKKKRYNEAWQGGETLSIAIGQGFNLVTPLQMAVFMAAVGNGGTLYRPIIVKTIEDSHGSIIKKIDPEITGSLPASSETLDIVRKGLLNVVQGDRGTARGIRLTGIEIAGKTGTAQVFSIKKGEKIDPEKLRYNLRDHAWFIAYAPAEKPVIAVSVIIEHGEHGSSSAAPVAGALIEQYIQTLSQKETVME